MKKLSALFAGVAVPASSVIVAAPASAAGSYDPNVTRIANPANVCKSIPGSIEHIVVGAGRIKTGPADETVELGPGDYITFAGDAPHHYEALEDSWAVLVLEHR